MQPRGLLTAMSLAGFVVFGLLLPGLLSPTAAQVVNTPLPLNIDLDPTRSNRIQNKDALLTPEEEKKPDTPEIDTEEFEKDARENELETSGDETADEESADEADAKIVLTQLRVDGVTVFTADMLEEQFLPWIGKEVSYQDLLKIAADITNLYVANGYITTRAVIPPQEIQNGVVFIQVIEGKVSDVQISGNEHVRSGYVKKRMSQKNGDVFRLQALEKDLISLNQNPLFKQVRATLKPGAEPGTSDIALAVEDVRPYHLQLSYDNQGRQLIGMYRMGATMSHDNLLGFGDSAMVNYTETTDGRTKSFFAQYKFPVLDGKLKLGANYAYSFVDLGGDFDRPTYDLTGDSFRTSIFAEMPLYHSGKWDISGDVSLNFIDSTSYSDTGRGPLSNKKLYASLGQLTAPDQFPITRPLITGINVLKQDQTGRWAFRGSMENGIAWFGGNALYVKFNADLTRIQSLGHGMILIARAQGQVSPDRLPSVTQYQIGGANTVRGFTEGLRIGDQGYFLSAELRIPPYGMPKLVKDRLQLVLFAEHGGVFEARGALNREPGYLTSYGFGVRGNLNRFLVGRLDFGAVMDPVRVQPDLRVHFGLTSTIF